MQRQELFCLRLPDPATLFGRPRTGPEQPIMGFSFGDGPLKGWRLENFRLKKSYASTEIPGIVSVLVETDAEFDPQPNPRRS